MCILRLVYLNKKLTNCTPIFLKFKFYNNVNKYNFNDDTQVYIACVLSKYLLCIYLT